MSTVGFIGLGNMGSGMAGRLVEAGHDVLVWNRSPEAAEPLVAAGARRVETPAEALAAPVSFSMLANDKVVESLLTAETLAGEPGRIHVATSSLSPEAADRLTAVHAAAGVGYVACPVLGRPPVAAAGQLNLLAAGDPALLEALTPYFDVIGKRTWVLGTTPRTANVVKAAVNYNLIHVLQAIGESLALVETEGVDPVEFTNLLSGTLFGGVAYTGYGEIIAERRYRPAGFSMELGLKDLGLAEGIATSAGIELPTIGALRQVFEASIADPELRDDDWSAMAEISRRGGLPRG